MGLDFVQNCKNVLRVIYLFIYLLFYVAFNSQGHIAMGSLAVSEVGGENSNHYTTTPPCSWCESIMAAHSLK